MASISTLEVLGYNLNSELAESEIFEESERGQLQHSSEPAFQG